MSDGEVDLAVFQRAVACLVVYDTDIFGVRDRGAYFWHNDNTYFRKAMFEILLRIINIPENTDTPSMH